LLIKYIIFKNKQTHSSGILKTIAVTEYLYDVITSQSYGLRHKLKRNIGVVKSLKYQTRNTLSKLLLSVVAYEL